MNRSLVLSLLIMMLALAGFAAAAEETKEPPGKTAFLANKCNTCHAISTEGITAKIKATGKKVPPDLSNVGEKRNADWIVKYLKKTEAINNEKHPKGWTGKEEDLTAISKWLETLKKPPEKKS